MEIPAGTLCKPVRFILSFFFTKPDAGPGRDIKNKINFRFHWFHLLDFELWFGKWNGIRYKTSAQKTIARCDINNPFMNRVSIYCFQFSKMHCNFQTEEFRMILLANWCFLLTFWRNCFLSSAVAELADRPRKMLITLDRLELDSWTM